MEDLTPNAEAPAEALGNSETAAEPEQVFDLEYVTKLRSEAAEGRVKAKRAESLARQAMRAVCGTPCSSSVPRSRKCRSIASASSALLLRSQCIGCPGLCCSLPFLLQ